MADEQFTVERAGRSIPVRRWRPEGAPRAAVQIAHGLSEHSGRYERFAQALTAAGYSVTASDHRGHGAGCPPADRGFFALQDGWRACLDDLAAVKGRIAADFPGTPLVFFGHSMGSIMGQQFISEQTGLAGAILSGTSGAPPAILPVGRLIARLERWRLGPRGKSPLVETLMFGAFNKPFAPARTRFDWLSRDPAEVDAYLADPWCGAPFSTQLAIDLLDALAPIASKATIARVPKSLPIYIFNGEFDPVAARVGALVDAYREAGVQSVTARVYPGGRHEMLNETNRDEVVADLIAWLRANVG